MGMDMDGLSIPHNLGPRPGGPELKTAKTPNHENNQKSSLGDLRRLGG
jgi:hypothetical protein